MLTAPFKRLYRWMAHSQSGFYVLTLLLVISMLNGCASAKLHGNSLPTLKEYSADFKSKMKAELPEVRENAPNTYTFVKDGVVLRDQVRAGQTIQQEQQKKKGLLGLGLFGK